MSVNNQMYNHFKGMKQAYANDDISSLEQYAACWMQLATENPFKYDTPEYEEFFQMKKSYDIWHKGAIDRKINRRRMVQHAKALCELNPKQPYVYDKEAEKAEKEAEAERIRKLEEEKRQTNDVQFVLDDMNNAFLKNDEVTFEQDVFCLMDITSENPFSVGMDEYEYFSIMMKCYQKSPMNKKRLMEAAKCLCDVMSYTEIYPEKTKKIINEEQQTVLGVLPENNKEKKSLFKFLRFWKKEGGQDDS